MKVIDFIKDYRLLDYKVTFEFREDNFFIKEETIDNVYNLSVQFLDREIDNWFIDFNNQKFVIDFKGEDKERIKELESKLEEANKQLDLDYVDENYIPKQKAKEMQAKIKELEAKLEFLKKQIDI